MPACEVNSDKVLRPAALGGTEFNPATAGRERRAARHRAAAGVIEITATCEAHKLRLQVCDDGAGLPEDYTAEDEGVGLRNTRARLARLYGDEHSFALRNGAGLMVEMVIPFHAVEATTNS
jgi:LytS/YehU family sensor histidine kinase